ncbi:hypothetical protein ACWD4N_33100 [Streptomyces sp. NPDC002586]
MSSSKETKAPRVEELEQTLREVLAHIRPQGHSSWELNTCLVTNEQVTKWWSVLGVVPRWEDAPDAIPDRRRVRDAPSSRPARPATRSEDVPGRAR